MSLFGQVWELRAGSQVFTGLDFRAKATWPASGESPMVDVVVNHPGPVLRAIVNAREERISVLAGYQRDQGPVEIGGGMVVRDSIEEDLASEDRPLEFQLSATRSARQLVLSASWASITAADVIEYVRQEAGLAGEVELGEDVEYSRYSIEGGVSRVLDELAEDTSSEWDIDGSTLRMWPVGQPRRETADVWSPATGLMRVSGTDDEIRARAFLRPSLRPGDAIRLSGTTHDGDLRVREVHHEIDTYGGDPWATTVLGVPR